jgi:hypothetical protein
MVIVYNTNDLYARLYRAVDKAVDTVIWGNIYGHIFDSVLNRVDDPVWNYINTAARYAVWDSMHTETNDFMHDYVDLLL